MHSKETKEKEGMHEISERIFLVLKERGIKQHELAEYLNVSPSLITKWKTSNYMPPVKAINEICDFLDVPVEYILSGKGTADTSEQVISQELSEDENELLAVYRRFSAKQKGAVLGNAKAILRKDFHM